MTNNTVQQDTEYEGIVTLQRLQAATEALRRRADLSNGGINSWIHAVIERWDEGMSAQGEEFRTDNSILEQHSLASLPKDGWRLPYGVDGSEGYQLMCEIDRRQNGQSLAGLAWPPSADPYAPANNPNHLYYLG